MKLYRVNSRLMTAISWLLICILVSGTSLNVLAAKVGPKHIAEERELESDDVRTDVEKFDAICIGQIVPVDSVGGVWFIACPYLVPTLLNIRNSFLERGPPR
jgi:hypothetical protein